MTSRERMLAALSCQEPDHIPLSFRGIAPLTVDVKNDRDWVERWLSFGLDPRIGLPMPVDVKPDVVVREWKEHPAEERYPILCKEYVTSKGTLRTEVRQTGDWTEGDSISLYEAAADLNVPRARKFLVEGPEDLDKLEALLCLPQDVDLTQMAEEATATRALAKEKEVILQGWGGAGGDMLTWLSGMERVALAVLDEPEFIHRYLEIIQRWDSAWAQVMLDWGADLLYRRGWYETPPAYSPRQFRAFIAPHLKQLADLAHQADAKIVHCSSMEPAPLAEIFVEIGVDAMYGVDSLQAKSDFTWLKENFGGKLCLWGGVSSPLTIERGTPDEVRAATANAIRILGPGGGFILSAVDSVRDPNCRENVDAMLETWRELGSYPIK